MLRQRAPYPLLQSAMEASRENCRAIAEEQVHEIVDDWIDAWNARDLGRIMSHYAERVVYSSALPQHLHRDVGNVICGRDGLREYFRKRLESDWESAHFTVLDMFAGVRGYSVCYTRGNDTVVLETITVDSQGRALHVEVQARDGRPLISTYAAEPDARYLERLACAHLYVHPGAYVFESMPANAKPNSGALACLRQTTCWIQLVPAHNKKEGKEGFRLFSFRLKDEAADSGLLTWLASRLRLSVQANVVVLGGNVDVTSPPVQPSRAAVQYLGCPYQLGEAVLAELEALRHCGTRRLERERACFA